MKSGPLRIDLDDVPQKLAVANFNDHSDPDFAVSGFGKVEVLLSPLYEPFELHGEGDSVAATEDYIAVGVEGTRKKSIGKVHIYRTSDFEELASSPIIGSDAGPGAKFGKAVALRTVSDAFCAPSGGSPPCELPDIEVPAEAALVVGAPGAANDFGEVYLLDGLTDSPTLVAQGGGPDDRFGWQVDFAGEDVVAASQWTSGNRRAEVYAAQPYELVPDQSLESLGAGWASGGIGIGAISGDIIIGAPNAKCDGSPSLGLAYLYVNGSPSAPEVLVSPSTVDPPDWNVYGWSAELIEGAPTNFVVIGEPGRDLGTGGNDGQVYIYAR